MHIYHYKIFDPTVKSDLCALVLVLGPAYEIPLKSYATMCHGTIDRHPVITVLPVFTFMSFTPCVVDIRDVR